MYVKHGEIYGLLGPNGAAKAMIMKRLTKLVKPMSSEMGTLVRD